MVQKLNLSSRDFAVIPHDTMLETIYEEHVPNGGRNNMVRTYTPSSHKKGCSNLVDTSLKHYITLPILQRIQNGSTSEKCFWGIILLASFALTIFVGRELLYEFNNTQVIIQTEKKARNNARVPSITFCTERNLESRYCGLDYRNMQTSVDKEKPCAYYTLQHRTKTKTRERNITINGQALTNIRHVTTLNTTHATCFVWNYKGEYRTADENNVIQLNIDFNRQQNNTKRIEMIIHEPGYNAMYEETGTLLESNSSYEIKIRDVNIQRSNGKIFSPKKCFSEKQIDIFPGEYTFTKCFKTLQCIDVMKQCGVTYDYCIHYVSRDLKLKYGKNRTISNATYCLQQWRSNNNLDVSQCKLPCDAVDYDYTYTNLVQKSNDKNGLNIYLRFKSPYLEITQIESDTLCGGDLYQFICMMAGLMAFGLGSSIPSIVEVLVYCFAYCVRGCSRR